MTNDFLKDDGKTLILPTGITDIEQGAFAGHNETEKVILPEGLRHIGQGAFADCPNLSSVTLPHTLETIGDGAFLECSALHELILPDSLRVIGDFAFQESGLYSVFIPTGVERIGESAFFSCSNLTHIDVSGHQTYIENNAFGSNYALRSGYVAPGYPAERSAFAELLYTLLWCSCPERHTQAVTLRAKQYIRSNEQIIMERILKMNYAPALHTLVQRRLLNTANIDYYLKQSLVGNQPELTALLLSVGSTTQEEDFVL